MGARPEPVPQVVQAPADSVSARLDEVHDLSQAIKSIRWERQRQKAQGKQVEAKPYSFSGRRRLCDVASHFSGKTEGGSEMDVKQQAASCKCVRTLLGLLSESYLRLGQAYIEDGQYNRAIEAVKFACDCAHEDCRIFFHEEDLRVRKATQFAWRMRRLTPPSREACFPKGLFKNQAWILAGDAYFKAQRTLDDSDVAIPHQEGEELRMSQEVEEELGGVVLSCGCQYFKYSNMLSRRYSLPRIVDNKWEKNLPAAVECYSNVIAWSWELKLDLMDSESECTECEYAENEDSENEDSENEDSENEDSRLVKIACRKMGFACHECGRRLAVLGWHAKNKADRFFRKSIKAFCKGKDLPNFELALCSRIEYHRRLAEFRVTQQGPEGRIKTMEEARVMYQEALNLCSEAKERLKKMGDGQHKEVDTEEAHTYLKLGMFLTIYVKQEEPNRKGQISAVEALHEAEKLYKKLGREREADHAQYQLDCIIRETRLMFQSVTSDVETLENAQKNLKLGILLMREDKFYYDNQEKPNRRGQTSAEEALHEAINLYEQLDRKENRKEEIAYAQFLLGCVLRDRMVFDSVKRDVPRLEKKLIETWVKASKYYIGVRDTDMFLRIRMEHSELYLALRRKTQMNKGLDQALISLLEGCRGAKFNGSPVCEEFIRKLLELLLTMWTAAKSQQNIASSNNPSKVNNYELLAQMYKCALKLNGEKDYHSLWSMWDNHAIAKSQS